MIESLFTGLTHAVEGSAGIALGAAFVWGVLSILLSPCHLASIPLIVGFIDQQGRITMRRAFTISLLFAVGILVTIGVIGAVTAAAGSTEAALDTGAGKRDSTSATTRVVSGVTTVAPGGALNSPMNGVLVELSTPPTDLTMCWPWPGNAKEPSAPVTTQGSLVWRSRSSFRSRQTVAPIT